MDTHGFFDRKMAYLLRFTFGLGISIHGIVRLSHLRAFAGGMVEQFAETPLPVAIVCLFAPNLVLAETIIGLLLLLLPTRLMADIRVSAPGSSSLPTVLRDVGIDQKLNSQVPLDLAFRDEDGSEVSLGRYFGRKPVVLVFAYYDCPMLCTLVLNGLLHSLKELKYNVGQEFEVVTVSFDPTEKPPLAAAKKAIYVGLYGRPNAGAGWHFLTGEESSIHQLAQAVGFRYDYDPNTKQYVHATGIMVLTADGRLARYFYGIEYPSGNVRLALVEASRGKIGSPVDGVLLYCSQYDPATGKYSLIVSHILKLAALATILCLGGLVVAMSVRRSHAAL